MTTNDYIEFRDKSGTTCTVEGGGGYASFSIDEHRLERPTEVELSQEDATGVILFLEAAFSKEETT